VIARETIPGDAEECVGEVLRRVTLAASAKAARETERRQAADESASGGLRFRKEAFLAVLKVSSSDPD